MPFSEQVCRQRRDFDVAQRWVDMRRGAVARVRCAFAMRFENLKIVFEGNSYGQGAGDAGGGLGSSHHVSPRFVLGLRKTENGRSVSVGKVIGDANLLGNVAPSAHVVAGNPRPRHSRPSLATPEAAVADVQTWFEKPKMWLATTGESASSLTGLKLRVGSSPGHPSCPTGV
jgi:hypothetical protein